MIKCLNWGEQRNLAIERNNHLCQACLIEEDKEREHDVHHVIPFEWFGVENYIKANDLRNLITLCISCHRSIEKTSNELSKIFIREDVIFLFFIFLMPL